jgi:hypothetical protein
MDDPNLTTNSRAVVDEPIEASSATTPLTADFYPLRLALHPNGGAVELKKADMVVGRHSSADVRLILPDVSRRHCRFMFMEGGWRVFDLESTNGIFVNGQKVRDCALQSGDLLRIGSYVFEVDLHAAKMVRQSLTSAASPVLPGTEGPHRKAS